MSPSSLSETLPLRRFLAHLLALKLERERWAREDSRRFQNEKREAYEGFLAIAFEVGVKTELLSGEVPVRGLVPEDESEEAIKASRAWLDSYEDSLSVRLI